MFDGFNMEIKLPQIVLVSCIFSIKLRSYSALSQLKNLRTVVKDKPEKC